MWECTPYELRIILQAAQDRQKADQDERITLAYMQAYWTAVWMCGKKPEPLDKILRREPKQGAMSDEQMFTIVKALHKTITGGG